MVLHGVLAVALLPPVGGLVVIGAGGDGPGVVKRRPTADGRCYSHVATFDVPYHLAHAPPATAMLKPALYYSTDGGKRWHLGAIDVDGVSPVTFRASARQSAGSSSSADGEYWLRVGLRRLGETAVPAFGQAREGVLVVVVDTRPPKVRLVPRLVHDVERGPTIAIRVVVEDEPPVGGLVVIGPLEPPDLAIEVTLPATDEAPAGRHLWIERAEVGREYRWLLDQRQAAPVAFHVTAVDQAGNVGRDTLEMSLLVREAAFRKLAQPEIVRPRVIRPVAPPSDDERLLAAAVEYAVDGPPLGEDESVEVWYTTDDGQTWHAPVPPHVTGSDPLSGAGAVIFTASRPGLYGLRLVLRRGEGIVGGPPAAGTKPQRYVLMERSADDSRIVGVEPAGTTRLGRAAAANVPTDLSVAPTPVPPSTRLPVTPVPTPPVVDRRVPARLAYERGNYLRLQGRWADACGHFREAIRLDPRCVEAHTDLAGCLYQREQFDEAARAYYRAIDLRPGQPDTRFSLARTLVHLGRQAEALSQLTEVVRLDPRDGEAWLVRGDLLLSLRGDTAGARACWRKALEIAPRNATWTALARRRLTQHPAR